MVVSEDLAGVLLPVKAARLILARASSSQYPAPCRLKAEEGLERVLKPTVRAACRISGGISYRADRHPHIILVPLVFVVRTQVQGERSSQ